MMNVKIQSNLKNDLELYFRLLPNVAIGVQEFEQDGTHTAMFTIDFKELHKVVTKKENVTITPNKQDLSVNANLVGLVGLYRNNGTSFQKIADRLNKDGYKTSRGGKLNKMQVSRLYEKYLKESNKKLEK